MKFFETTHLFNSNWESTTLASWRKYPNDKAPHVKHVEIISREVDPISGKLKTERLILVEQKVPRLIKKILGATGESLCLEYSEVDPVTKEMSMTSINLTLSNLLSVTERIVYKPNEQDPTKTSFYQSANVSANGLISKFGSIVEDYSLRVFKDNALVGRMGFEQVLNIILQEQKSLAH
ncbi:hypothetical protein BB559_003325 [Furculomyces boomerangus]|uniref:PRELI/MSF1 domain-containing protein n=2 Tax=Harpellales TaxID=61421 RepID=A0A2T9YB13_9FUNG|nr:hypothetical protein BB559_005043 [Furculomyces boomerangus]PVU93339.1 hypothetical protein BB559_003325 [Furculomyces boomerangus]PWA01560.1 hypothetical protein BB558_002342 [Smittium angustum]